MTDATLATIDQADDDQPRTERVNPTGAVAQLYPPEIRDALVRASKVHAPDVIDQLTDILAERGFCRPRHDKGLFVSRSPAAR
jgi:hypothetical protein